MQDPYAILGLPQDASDEQIRDAYRTLAQIYHPDRYQGSPPKVKTEAEKRMQELTAAYSVLTRSRTGRLAAHPPAPSPPAQPRQQAARATRAPWKVSFSQSRRSLYSSWSGTSGEIESRANGTTLRSRCQKEHEEVVGTLLHARLGRWVTSTGNPTSSGPKRQHRVAVIRRGRTHLVGYDGVAYGVWLKGKESSRPIKFFPKSDGGLEQAYRLFEQVESPDGGTHRRPRLMSVTTSPRFPVVSANG